MIHAASRALKIMLTSAMVICAFNSHALEPQPILIYCSEGSPAGFDPAQYTTSVDLSASSTTLYNQLVQFKRGETQIEPGLATRWEISPDGLSYTFHLRQGVKFHTTSFFKPTRDFNADDVLFSFNRMLDANLPFQKAYPVQFPYFTDMGLNKNIAKVEKIDPYTVRFTLHKIDAPFLQDLAMPFASILSAEYAEKLLADGKASDINWHPIGTGPYIFRSYVRDSTIRFIGNFEYWKKGAVRLTNLIFSITVDPAVRVQKLKRNECQVMSYPRPADIVSLKGQPGLALPSQVGFNVGYVAYNTTHKPLDQVLVRRALDMAVNKKAIIQAVYGGVGQVAQGPMPPTQWSYDKTLKDAPYNPQAAKALLAQAGYPHGFNLSLWAMPVQRPYNPNARLMAEMIQADWAKIGVQAKIVTYEWGEYVKRAHAGEHDTILIGWTGDNGDPDNWLSVLLSCNAVNGTNFSRWCSQPFDALLTQARQTTDRAKREILYKQAQQIFKRELPFTPIGHSTVYQPISRQVTNFKIDPFGLIKFSGVGLRNGEGAE